MEQPVKVFEDSVTYSQIEFVERIGKSKAWAERGRWAGTGPKFLKIGRSVRYLGRDLNLWIESQTRSNTGQGA